MPELTPVRSLGSALTLLLAAFGGAIATAPAAAPAIAEVRALVVGIDDYAHISRLQGAVNDAQAVRQALEGAGVDDLTLLLDRQATRAAIRDGINGMMRRADPGDVIVLHYAGHGDTMRADNDPTERDRADELLLLSGFNHHALDSRDFILDNDLADWLGQRNDVTVLFFADACHSGTMHRSADPRVATLGTRDGGIIRGAIPPAFLEDPLPMPLTPGDVLDTAAGAASESVFYFGAVGDHELVPEVRVDGRVHGLLSWSLARAIDGEADEDGDGWLTKGELQSFLIETVDRHSNQQQRPQVHPDFAEDTRLLPIGGRAPARPPPVTLTMINAPPATIAEARRRLGPLLQLDQGAGADLVWDVATNEIIETGDAVTFYPPGDMTLNDMFEAVEAIADKYDLVERLRRMASHSGHGLTIRIAPDAGVHVAGAVVDFEVTGHAHGTFTLFNVASTGALQFLFPQSATAQDRFPVGQPIALPLTVTPPFGADYLVAIASSAPLTTLHRLLRSGRADGDGVIRAIAAAQERIDVQIGVLGAYTRPD